MRVWTDLCDWKCSYAAENDFMQVWTNLCNRKLSYSAVIKFMPHCTDLWDRICSHSAGNDFMRVWTNLSDRKCFNMAGNDFMCVLTNLCDRKYSYIGGNDFMQVWTNLCYRECFSVTNSWQELQFEIPAKIRTGMCRALLCGDWWWLITQPRPIWKKAPPGLQRPSHTESTSGMTTSTPMVRTHTLDPTPDAPRP